MDGAGELGGRGTNKGNEWKASVHTVRTAVLLEKWITTSEACAGGLPAGGGANGSQGAVAGAR